jgi:hypothetical protein
MLWRVRNSRGRPSNAPAAFIHPCQPIVAKQPPSGRGWAHEVKHDGYRPQIHIRDGRVRLYTINGADWSKRYPLIVRDAARIIRSSTSSLNSLGWFGSSLLSILVAKSMRPVGAQSRFTTPLSWLLNRLFSLPKLVITVSGLAISHSCHGNYARSDSSIQSLAPSQDVRRQRRSLAHAHTGGCGARSGALGPIGRAARTQQRNQSFIVRAANSVCTGHGTQGLRGPGLCLWARDQNT